MGLSSQCRDTDMGMRAWQLEWDEQMNPVRPTMFETVLKSARGKDIFAELDEILRVVCDQSYKVSPEIVGRLGSVYEQLAELTNFSFAAQVVESHIRICFSTFLTNQYRGTSEVHNVFREVDQMYQGFQQQLLVYFGNKVVDQDRLLAVPRGETAEAARKTIMEKNLP